MPGQLTIKVHFEVQKNHNQSNVLICGKYTIPYLLDMNSHFPYRSDTMRDIKLWITNCLVNHIEVNLSTPQQTVGF